MNYVILVSLALLFQISKSHAQRTEGPLRFSESDSLETVVIDSFSHRDHQGARKIEDSALEYRGLHNFSAEAKRADESFPWREGPFLVDGDIVPKLDLRVSSHAKVFSRLVFSYILGGWFTDQDGRAISNPNRHFRSNHVRSWCTTPGVVDGPSGREAVFGLTKELGLKPNPVFPEQTEEVGFEESLWDNSNKDQRPSGWGQAFYNKVVCNKYQEIFGDVEDLRIPIMNDSELLENDFGFVAFKLHYNAMANWKAYLPFAGAYSSLANVSETRGESKRVLKSIPLIQISVSMKVDPKYVAGLVAADGEPKADYWVMLAYYHDAKFDAGVQNLDGLPAELQHMRPMGIQTGFGPENSIVFEGSKSNHRVNVVNADGEIVGHKWHGNDDQSLLNGPADNAYSSCLGCHAGFNYMDVLERKDPRRGGADGLSIFDRETFKSVKSEYGKREDFNLQLSNAFNRVKSWLELVQ